MMDVRTKYAGAMINEEDLEIAKAVHEFVDKEIMPRRLDLDGGWHHDEKLARDTFDKLHKGLVDLGAQRAFFPEKYGGLGLRSTAAQMMLLEEIARGDLGLSLHLGVIYWVLGPAFMARRSNLLDQFLPKICDDKPHACCMALTEPEGGVNVEDPAQHGRAIATRAELDGDEYVINGEKIWPSCSGIADITYLTLCTTDPKKGDEGIALIYVPPDVDGLSFGKPLEKMGFCWSDINTEIFFDNVRVPKENRVAGPGKDAQILHNSIAGGRVGSASYAVGGAQACLEEVIEYTKDREIVGKPVRERSLHAGMIGEMVMAIDAARAYYLQAAYMIDSRAYGRPGEPLMLSKTTGAKVFSCDIAVLVTNKAMELMGAYGYSPEFNIEKYLRDVKMIQLWEGGAQLGRLDVTRGYYPFEWAPGR